MHLVRSEIMTNLTNKLLLAFTGVVLFSVTIAYSSSDDECNKDIEAFLNCNNPKVIKYLTALTKKDIGKVLNGVRLTDGSMTLKGRTFLGEAKGIGQGVHLYIFKINKNREAYLWVDENGTALDLPVCPKSVSFESSYGLSGDVYTWRAAQPGHGIVQTMCIKKEWIKKIQ